jgi:phytoene dehydrogenase-like protein
VSSEECSAAPSPEEKWAANREKVAFAMTFPGLIREWADARGKTVDTIVESGDARVAIFTDGTFAVVPSRDLDPAAVVAALAAARPRLERAHAEAYAELDRLASRDRELSRRARLENILGAIRHNAADIPELKDAVRRLAASLPDHTETDGQKDQTAGR